MTQPYQNLVSMFKIEKSAEQTKRYSKIEGASKTCGYQFVGGLTWKIKREKSGLDWV